jgi:amino acid transporter
MSTWIIGPTKGLLAAAESGDLPPIFRKVNHNGVPIALLFAQAIIVTVLAFLFLFMPTVSSGFWILSVLVAELYLIMYLLMFAAAITLRYKKPDVERPYRIPGGKYGIWIVSGLGIIGSLFALIIGFIPPGQIETGSKGFYVTFLIIGTLIGCLAPFIITWFKKPHWEQS